jgi:hypothetical protein
LTLGSRCPAAGLPCRRAGHQGLEDGTPAFTSAVAALHGFAFLRRLGLGQRSQRGQPRVAGGSHCGSNYSSSQAAGAGQGSRSVEEAGPARVGPIAASSATGGAEAAQGPCLAGASTSAVATASDDGVTPSESLRRAMAGIHMHATALTRWLARRLAALRHANGAPVVELYGRWASQLGRGEGQGGTESGGPPHGPTLAFNLRRADGSWVGYAEVGGVVGPRCGGDALVRTLAAHPVRRS